MAGSGAHGARAGGKRCRITTPPVCCALLLPGTLRHTHDVKKAQHRRQSAPAATEPVLPLSSGGARWDVSGKMLKSTLYVKKRFDVSKRTSLNVKAVRTT